MRKNIFTDRVVVCGLCVDFVGVTEFEDYDENKSNNGGSYYQPTHEISWSVNGANYTLTIEDTSRWDFGVRIYVQLDKDNCCIAQASYGSLAGEEYTDFEGSDFDCSVAIAIAASIGYHIPYKEED